MEFADRFVSFMLWDGVAILIFAGIVIGGILLRHTLRGAIIASFIPFANIFIVIGKNTFPETFTVAPFLSAATTIVMLVALAIVAMPILTGDHFI